MASSKFLGDSALNSMILAMDMGLLLFYKQVRAVAASV
jgi:hypothetical protein